MTGAHVAHHFESREQQFDSGKLGIWVFLLTEILFFSGLFCAYAIYRARHPEIFVHAQQYLDANLGALNTVVLLFSSLTMAWAVRCAQLGQRRGLVICLVITLVCAFAFMGVKAIEYQHKWHDGLLPGRFFGAETGGIENVHIFFGVYFTMTGLHGIHVLAGIVVIAWLLRRAWRGDFGPQRYAAVDYTALYWHLVDLVWIFLFPLLYLIR